VDVINETSDGKESELRNRGRDDLKKTTKIEIEHDNAK